MQLKDSTGTMSVNQHIISLSFLKLFFNYMYIVDILLCCGDIIITHKVLYTYKLYIYTVLVGTHM